VKGYITIDNDLIKVDSIAAVFEDRHGPAFSINGKRVLKGCTVLFTNSNEKAYYPEWFAHNIVTKMEESIT